MKRHLLTIFLLIAPFCTILSNEQFIFKQISQKEGLTATVNSIYKEYDGDVWIGSPNGLYSFNGNMLHSYQDSIFSGRRVYHTSADRNGDLWILTNKWPIRKRGRHFEMIRPEGDMSDGQPFLCMCQDEEGIWFGSNRMIYRYSFKDSSLSRFKDLDEKPDFLIRNINLIDRHTLLCSSHNGLIFIDTRTGEIKETPFAVFNEVTATLVDSRGKIWVSFYNNGIIVFEKDGTILRRYDTSCSDLSNDVVLCMTERDSSIWAGTDGGGINIIDPRSNRIRVLSHIAGDPSSLPAHSIKSIYNDNYGNIWAGSIREGLIRISLSGMKTYSDSHIGSDTGLSNPTVLCLYQDKGSEDIWIGTDGEGVNRFNPRTGKFTHYPKTLKTKIVSIAEYSSSELALSVYADRIWLFNKNTGNIRPLHIDDPDINYMLRYAGRSMNLANESDGSLLLISNKVSRLDKATGKCKNIGFNIGDKANGNLLAISSTPEGLWMHDSYNIYLLPEGGDQIIRKGHTNKHVINSGHMDSDGIIWLATNEGMCRFNTAEKTFSHVRTTLLQRAVSVVCDSSSRVWVGADGSLYAYLKDSDSFTLFGSSDGAEPNEYLSKPRLLSTEGDVYLGGVQGMLRIDKDYSIDMTDEPALKLYSMTIDNESITADNDGLCRIPRNSKRIEISVTSQEKDIFRDKVYRFMIPDIGISYESKSPVMTIHKLNDPGRHDITVTCTRRNGEWCEPVRLLTIDVPQPWYFSGWFVTCVIIFACSVAATFHIATIRRRRNRLQLALKEQEQKVYEDKVRMLINISHELRTPLTLIMAPLKRLLSETGKDERHSATLSRIYRQSRRMRDLLNMVLDLRKMETGNTQLKIESLDFNKWVLESTSDIINEEKEAGINIVTELDPAISEVEFDRQKCDTVMTNILMNAIKHSKSGDTITLKTELREDAVRTTISDQGPGLRDTDMSRLFTRFYQNNHEQYGSGIGLSFSKILVELHEGRIGAGNNAGKGAFFWWEIPVRTSSERADAIPARAYLNDILGHDSISVSSTDETGRFSTSDMSIMLVDDNLDLLEFLKEALCTEFSDVILATSGNMAMKTLNSGNLPDIIVSDVNMPDGDGFQLCHDLKSNDKFSHIPVVLLTARGEEKSQSDSYRAGAEAFMAKPFEIETLMELLRGILKRKAEIRKKYLDNDTEDGYTSSDESMIIQLNKVISEHLDNPELDQKIICMELGMSRASLYNKMKTISGMGVKEYITKIRIEKAKAMMENSDRSITEISEMTGFSGPSYFSTAFKNHTGMTPSQYKKQHKA